MQYEVTDGVHAREKKGLKKKDLHTVSMPVCFSSWIVCVRMSRDTCRHIRYRLTSSVQSYILRSSPDGDQKAGSAELISIWLFHIPFHPPPPTAFLPASRRPAPLLWSEDCGHGNSPGLLWSWFLFVFMSAINGDMRPDQSWRGGTALCASWSISSCHSSWEFDSFPVSSYLEVAELYYNKGNFWFSGGVCTSLHLLS